jgi:hypothetical protein
MAFIDTAGRYLGFESTYQLLDGGWQLNGDQWSFTTSNPVSIISITDGAVPIASGLPGSGTVNPRVRFEGMFGFNTTLTTAFAHDYAIANSLAVSQADLAGTWAATNRLSVSIDGTGAMTGRLTGAVEGDCALAGSVLQAATGTAKNMFTVSLAPSTGMTGACNLKTGQVYEGFAAITFTDIGPSGAPFHVRSLTFIVRKDSSWFAGELPRS